MKMRKIRKGDIAKFTCHKCFHNWEVTLPDDHKGCPSCGHLYVSWNNYDELTKPEK